MCGKILENVKGGYFLDPAIIVFLVIFSLGLVGLYFSRKTASKAKKLGAKKHTIAIHMHGISWLPQHSLASMYFTDEKMIIESKKMTFELNYDQVTAAEGVTKTDLLTKDKSVIGRGIAGGLILGPVGAIVGGMSGVGQKKIKGDFLIINYLSSGQSEPNVLIFDVKNILMAEKLAKLIKPRTPINPTQTMTL
jgi:hypothetical protein